jgi:hypothetical protein
LANGFTDMALFTPVKGTKKEHFNLLARSCGKYGSGYHRAP